MFNGLTTAVRTLSILPLPGRDAASFAASLGWFPLVGSLIALPLCAMAIYLGEHWSAGAAMLMVASSVVLTRGLHLDGLADCVDGFGGGAKRERVLEIMKDPCVGAFGAMSLILVLAAKGGRRWGREGVGVVGSGCRFAICKKNGKSKPSGNKMG